MYLDPWTTHLAPGLPAAILHALEYTALCALYTVPFALTILEAAVFHFFEQTGANTMITFGLIIPGVLLFLAAPFNARVRGIQAAISPLFRTLYWYSVFGLLIAIVAVEMTERLLSPSQCAFFNPFSWPMCLSSAFAPEAPRDRAAAMVLTNATKSAYLAFTKAVSTIDAQPPYGQEAVHWAHAHLPSALFVPGAPAIAG